MSEAYQLRVNGRDVAVTNAAIEENLLFVLRERVGLTGTKGACEEGECGSCTVLIDGEAVCACLVLAASARGQEITTVEGLASAGAATDVQRAFVEAGAVQCGFCTPGLIVAVHAMLERDPAPDELAIREALAGNVCRCTGYGRIIAAVRDVIAARAEYTDREAAT